MLEMMKRLHIRSASEQVADFLKEEIRQRTWTGTMPGEQWLVTQLHAGRNTVRAALDLLETEGILLPQGHGRRRQIATIDTNSSKNFRVTLLLHSPRDRHDGDIYDILHQLSIRGHEVTVAPKSLTELDMQVDRVARMVKQIETDAWVVIAGASEVLEWFATQSTPSFALFGRFSQYAMAGTGPNKSPAYKEAVRRLVALGHRRIVLLQPEHARKPEFGKFTLEILAEIESHGIKVGSYNVPDWECTPAGLRNCLDSLFGITPPTALFIEEPHEFYAVRDHLAKKGIYAPRDVSLICSDDHPTFHWCDPPVTCIKWSYAPLVRRIVNWVKHVSNGKDDRRIIKFKAHLIEGGTIGPVPKGR